MADTNISIAAAQDGLDAIVDLLDGGASAGTLRIYDSGAAQPADPDTAVPGGSSILSEHTLNDPAFGNAADQNPDAMATANSIADDTSANNSGTALWFRAFDSAGNAVIDGDVTATGGGGDLELNSTSITAGATVSITSWTITLPQ